METEDKIQENILEKLRKYGDSVLGDYASPRQPAKRKLHHEGVKSDGGGQKKKMKKKKKKKTNNMSQKTLQKSAKEKHSSMKEFEEELRLFQESQKLKEMGRKEDAEMDRRKEEDVRKTKKRRVPEVIVFEDPTKRKNERLPNASDARNRDLNEDLEFDRARHEVWKLGISGLAYGDKEKQQAAKAIQLGAKPPKKEYVNYKDLMETKKQTKMEEQQQREIDRQMGLKTAKKKGEKIQLQNKGFWTDKTQRKGVYVDGQLGKYKRGVQVFTKRDIARIKIQRGGKTGRR